MPEPTAKLRLVVPRELRCAVVIAVGVVAAGCATIDDSSVTLSGEVGARIADMQSVHLASIEAYFDVERRRIDDFLTNTWEPLFLRNFLGTSGILRDLQTASILTANQLQQIENAIADYLDDESEAPQAVARLSMALSDSRRNERELVTHVLGDFVEDDRLGAATEHVSRLLVSEEPARMILDFAEDAHNEMQLQRQELMEPLEREYRRVRSEVQTAYGELAAAQGLITGRLAAASRIRREQDALFARVLGERSAQGIRESLSDVSADVGTFLECAESVVNESDSRQVHSADLRSLLESALSSDSC